MDLLSQVAVTVHSLSIQILRYKMLKNKIQILL